MSSDVELLPLPPSPLVQMSWGGPGAEVRHTTLYTADHMRAYIRANMEPLQVEVEKLRRLVQERDTMLGKRLCAGVNADGKPRCLSLAEAVGRAERLNQLLTAYQRAVNRVDDGIEYAIPMPAESRSALYAILSDLSEEVAAIAGDAQ